MSKLSVKKPYTVIVGILLVIVLGYISFQHMSTDLLPSMNLPYVVVYTPYPGATPEQVESEIVRPMEASFATLTDIKKLTSQSRDNVGVVIMQFNDGANMDTALIEISSRLDQLKGEFDDDVGAPVAMKLNPDMLPVAILSVSRDDMDILQLSDYVNDELVPGFEGLNGVASATANGVIEQEVDVTIEQSRIDVVNSAILADVDKELAKVEDELNAAQAKISDGKRQLARGKEAAYEQLAQAEAALAEGQSQIGPAIEQLTAQQAELTAQREQLAASVTLMEAAMNMTDEERAAVQAAATQVAELRQQREELQTQLAAMQESGDDSVLLEVRRQAQNQRDELASVRDGLQTYLDDLELMDADALNAEIDRLNAEIEQAEKDLQEKEEALAQAVRRRDALKDEVDGLTARLAAGEKADADNTPGTDATPAPDTSASPAGSPEASPDASPKASPETNPETSPEASPGTNPTPNNAGGVIVIPLENNAPGTGAEGSPDSTADEKREEEQDAGTSGESQSDENPGTDPAAPQADPTDGQGETVPAQAQSDAPAEKEGEADPGTENAAAKEENSTADQAENAAPEKGEVPAAENAADTAPVKEESTSAERKAAPAAGKVESAAAEKAESSSDAGHEQTSETHAEPQAREGSDDAGSADAVTAARPGTAFAEEADPDALASRLEAAKAELDEANADVSEKTAEADEARKALNRLKLTREAKQRALDTLTDNSSDTASRAQEARAAIAALDERIAALDAELAKYDEQLASGEGGAALMAQMLTALDEQLDALDSPEVEQATTLLTDPEALNTQYAQASEGLAQMDAGIDQMNTAVDKLKQGIIPGGMIPGMDEDTNLAEAGAELAAAREEMESMFSQASAMLSKAEKELAKARKEFMDKREEALEEAGIDGVITVQMVAQLLGAQNLAMPAGYVKKADGDQVLVRVGDKFGSVDEMKRLKLFDLDLDTIKEVRLMDVATVELTDDRDEVFTKLNGQDGILLSLEKQSTFSTADVSKTVLNYARQLQAEHPELHIVDLMNQGEYIDIVVDSVLQNLLSGGGLAILVLLLFLLDWRPTLTVAFSIPISVVMAFVAMYFSGITLNVLSLSGLSLGIGMLVDNSIVSIENIYRLHDEEEVPLLRACVEGVKSVAGALFSSTLTTICVFLPIVFVQGMARDLFSDMGLTIAYSLLASLLVAMTVVPMMCSYLMRRSKPKKHRVFSKLQAAYGAMLRGALRVKPLVLLAALALLAFSGMQVTKMGISFMPEVNSRQMSAELTPDKNLSGADQKAQASQIMTDMLEIKGIESIGLMDGSGTLLSTGGGSGYSYYIIVDEAAGVKNVDIARQIDDIGKKYGADLTAQASTMDISMLAGDGISVEITGDDIEVLQQIAADLAQLARDTEGTVDVDDGLEDAVPELRLIVNKERAIADNLTVAQVYQFIAQKLMGKTEVSKVTLDGKEMKIQLIEGRNKNLRPDDIQDLEIEVEKENEDVMVRVGDITEVRDASSLSTISRASQRRMVTVSFQVAEGYSANHVSDAFAEKLKAYALPDGYKAELAGENETVMGIMEDLVWMILVAVLLIFLIMVAQFQSFKSPIIVMFTIPLAFTGGLIALLVTKMDLSIVAMLGFLVLSGVVVNNGIVFIDCVNQLRIGGMEKREALVEAGRQRLRPILMTAMTTILGMSTMALGHGTGAEMMQPMAVVSIGGLTYATLMTLFVVPVLYDLFNGRNMKAREIQMIREAAGMNGDEVIYGDPAPAAPASPAPVVPVAPVEPAAPVVPAAPTEPVVPTRPLRTAAAPVLEADAVGNAMPVAPSRDPSAAATAQVAPSGDPNASTTAQSDPTASPPAPVFAPRAELTRPAAKPITVRMNRPSLKE